MALLKYSWWDSKNAKIPDKKSRVESVYFNRVWLTTRHCFCKRPDWSPHTHSRHATAAPFERILCVSWGKKELKTRARVCVYACGHACAVDADVLHFQQLRGPLFILKVKSCWEAEAPHWRPDGADTARLIVHTCWSVPRLGLTAAHKADDALNRQCISMRGSYHLHLSVYVLVVRGGADAKHICRPDKLQSCGVCNPKPGQWWSPLPASADSILIYDSNEYRFSRSSFPPLFPSISPFNKRVNDVCALISNQLFLFSFYLSLDKFSVAPAEGNASLSTVLYLITNRTFDSKQGNNEGTFNSESVTSASTMWGHKFVSASFHMNKHVNSMCSCYVPPFYPAL